MSTTFATINNTLRGSVRHCARSATGGFPAPTSNSTYLSASACHDYHLTPRFGSRHRRRYSFKMIVNNSEQRLQYMYFVLSGVVASALLALVYISVWTTTDEMLRERLQKIQQDVIFIKPTLNWNHNSTWRYIGNHTYKHQIYSAYFDHRISILDIESYGNEIPLGSFRVFALLPKRFRSSLYCILRYDDFTMKEVQPQEAVASQETHDFPFVVYTIMCPFFAEQASKHVYLPNSIAIAYAANWLSHMSPTFVPISYPKNISHMFEKSRPVLSVCVGPLQMHYDNAMRIVEFVEMYRILGAEHFYFYVLNATQEVMRTVAYYRKLNLATVLFWNVDQQHTEDLHYSGILAQINDCAYRAMVVDNYRYIAVVDFDEILVPYKHNSLSAFLRQCDEGRTAAYIFRNAFFYKKDSNDTFSVPKHARNRQLYTQTKVRRAGDILPAYTRSKYIGNPRAIVEAGNHKLWRMAPGYTETVVHTSVGVSHHYRDKCINCREILLVDYTARRFGSLIWDQVDEACLHIFLEKQGICPAGQN